MMVVFFFFKYNIFIKLFTGDAVKVDESLFQDLDDLDIDEDDEDFDPNNYNSDDDSSS